MSGQNATGTDGRAVDDVFGEIEQARGVEDYRAEGVVRIRAGIRLGVLNAYATTLAAALDEAVVTTLARPSAGDAPGAGRPCTVCPDGR